jgi:hypothetical protein
MMRVMSVDVGAGPEFSHTTPRELFTGAFGTATPLRSWDVTADGARFLVVVRRTPPSPRWQRSISRTTSGTIARLWPG